jgi:hypothetical protein
MGKAMAEGFGPRCVWGYTRLLNAVYWAIASDKTRILIQDDAKWLCEAGANGDMTGFKGPVDRLGTAHRQAFDEGDFPRTVTQVWINVIGFSRGAACARAFVHKLINEWAPRGNLTTETGRYAISYTVNFMGLFDTVASVGLPDSTRPLLNLKRIAGHGGFAGDGAMAIPKGVRFCWHAFSIHEQRMSFPLDSIRQGHSYPGTIRFELAYPGVHSDAWLGTTDPTSCVEDAMKFGMGHRERHDRKVRGARGRAWAAQSEGSAGRSGAEENLHSMPAQSRQERLRPGTSPTVRPTP